MRHFIQSASNRIKMQAGGPALLILLLFAQLAFAQKTFLSGQKTGNRFNSGVLSIGAGISVPPFSSHSSGIPISIFRFYYGDAILNDDNVATPAVLTATNQVSAVGVKVSGADVYAQFRKASPLTTNILANTTTYFTLKEKPVITGLKVSLTGLVGLTDLANITGDGYSGAAAYSLSGSGNVNEGSKAGTSTTKILIDKSGSYFAAVTPNADYNSVRLNVTIPDVDVDVLSGYAINVYNAYTEAAGSTCSVRPKFTDPGFASGVSLASGVTTPLNLNAIVTSPQSAIDDSPTTFSSFSTGVANVGVVGSIAQSIYFDHKASATDQVKIHLALGQSLIALDLGSAGVTFKAYNGSTLVNTQTLSQSLALLGLNLGTILTVNGSGDTEVTTTVKPGAIFDRIEISLNSSLAGANVIGDALKLYDVEISAPVPTISSSVTLGANNSLTVYAGATLPTITATSAGNQISWYLGNSATALSGSPANSPYALPVTSIATPGSYVYYAETKSTCGNVSAKVAVNITVLAAPTYTNPTSVNEGTNYSGSARSIVVTGQPSSIYTFSAPSGLPAGLTLNSDGTITGTPTAGTASPGGTTVNFTADVTDATLSLSVATAHSFSIFVYPQLIASATTLPNSYVGITPYPITSIPVPTGGSGIVANYTYVTTGSVPPGITITNGVISGAPTMDGTYNFSVRVTDPASGQFVDQAYTVVIGPALVANPATLPSSYVSAGTYPVTAIPVPTGGSGNFSEYTYVVTGGIPTGMSIVNGVISGAPTAPGTYNFSVKVTDPVSGLFVNQPYSIVISPQLLIPGATFPSVSVNETSYSVDISESLNGTVSGSATGGKIGATKTYSLTDPNARTTAVPSGFTISPSGLLSGNPFSAGKGTYTFTVYVTDGEQTTNGLYTLDITGALPVTLSSFSAKKEGQTAQLSWSTTSETNSQIFDVERSQNGKEWSKIGDKEAQGESAAIATYSFSDITPLNGANLYRLKMVDRDGTFAYSRIESLNFALEMAMKIYPNPVANSENLEIAVNDWSMVRAVKVINSMGRVVFETSSSFGKGIQTANLTAGLYVVQVVGTDGKVTSHKFVKL